MTVTLKHKRPCIECPWRKESPPGWLGGFAAEWFTERVYADVPLNCHMSVGAHEHKPEEAIQQEAPLCAGSLIAYRNMCKLPRRTDLAEAVRSVEPSSEVFPHPHFFLHHHET